MPVSSGLRSRPSFAAQRTSFWGVNPAVPLASYVPKVVFAALLVASIAAVGAASFWAVDLHQSASLADSEVPTVTGTIPRAN